MYGERIQPADLIYYRSTYDYRVPCCLCAIDGSDDENYTETNVFIQANGTYSGEYVAACALNRCGYLGMSQHLRK